MADWFSVCFSCDAPETDRLKQLEAALAKFDGWLKEGNNNEHRVLGLNTTLDGLGRTCLSVRLCKDSAK